MRAIAFLIMFFPWVSNAADIDYLMIKLMQPNKVIEQKTGPVDEMARFVKQIEVDINKKLSAEITPPTWGFLVVAIRADGQVKAWIDTDDKISPSIGKAMIDVVQSTKAFPVNAGAVVFSLGFGINGADLPPNTMPFPVEWKKVANCKNEDCIDLDIEAIVLDSW